MTIKKGFSLAEVLLTLGIISVIAAMGITISKKGTERAHNLYYYSGYSSLVDAVSDVNINGVSIKNDFPGFGEELKKRFTRAERRTTAPDGVLRTDITLPNGIVYTIMCPTAGASCPGANSYLITMAIPQIDAKPSNTMFLYYTPEGEENTVPDGIYPISGGTMDLTTRTDILPFYIDVWSRGRIFANNYVPDGSGETPPDFQRRVFTSFIDAYCDRYGTNISHQGTTVISCNGHAGPTQSEGVLRVENPQKVF